MSHKINQKIVFCCINRIFNILSKYLVFVTKTQNYYFQTIREKSSSKVKFINFFTIIVLYRKSISDFDTRQTFNLEKYCTWRMHGQKGRKRLERKQLFNLRFHINAVYIHSHKANHIIPTKQPQCIIH